MCVSVRESIRAVVFVYTASKVCLRALVEYTPVLDCHYLAGLCICVYSQRRLWDGGCFFSGAFKRVHEFCLATAVGHHAWGVVIRVCVCVGVPCVWLRAAVCTVCVITYFTGCGEYCCEHIVIFHHPYRSRRCHRIFRQRGSGLGVFHTVRHEFARQSSSGLPYVL